MFQKAKTSSQIKAFAGAPPKAEGPPDLGEAKKSGIHTSSSFLLTAPTTPPLGALKALAAHPKLLW